MSHLLTVVVLGSWSWSRGTPRPLLGGLGLRMHLGTLVLVFVLAVAVLVLKNGLAYITAHAAHLKLESHTIS